MMGWCVVILSCPLRVSSGAEVTFESRHRNDGGEVHTKTHTLAAGHIGIVVMDMWDKHWDPTATRRVGAMVPKINEFLANARAAGATGT